MKKYNALNMTRQKHLNLVRSIGEIHTAIDEFVEDPCDSTVNVLVAKIKGLDKNHELFKSSIADLMESSIE